MVLRNVNISYFKSTNASRMSEQGGPILHVIVVGFHHKKGCQVSKHIAFSRRHPTFPVNAIACFVLLRWSIRFHHSFLGHPTNVRPVGNTCLLLHFLTDLTISMKTPCISIYLVLRIPRAPFLVSPASDKFLLRYVRSKFGT